MGRFLSHRSPESAAEIPTPSASIRAGYFAESVRRGAPDTRFHLRSGTTAKAPQLPHRNFLHLDSHPKIAETSLLYLARFISPLRRPDQSTLHLEPSRT
jgi:hypothetical protein